jgi:hypothetical protein
MEAVAPGERLRMTIVRAALVQAVWTGDKESMIRHHEEQARPRVPR